MSIENFALTSESEERKVREKQLDQQLEKLKLTVEQISRAMTEEQKAELMGKKTLESLNRMTLQQSQECTDDIVRKTMLSMLQKTPVDVP